LNYKKGVLLMNYKDKFVGTTIYGFCNGYFGRDSYDDKVIIASGENWIVGKTQYGYVEFASFDDGEEMEELIASWSVREDNDCGW